MKIATTTLDFGSFCNTDVERIRELHRAGFRYIDLSMYEFTPDSVYMQDNWKDEVCKIKNAADELGMTFVQAHSQGGNPISDDPSHVDFHFRATVRSIEICSMLGIKNTVSHVGIKDGISKEEWFDLNKSALKKFFPYMEHYGVNLLCENAARSLLRGRYYISSGKDMREYIKYVDHPQYHGCWDTGHANCDGNQYDEIMAIGDELYAIHYNDNHGAMDDHIAPFLGTLNHDEVINALIDVGFKGYFTLECVNSLITYNQWQGKRRRFDSASKLREPQLFMQRHMEAMAYDTAEWMLKEYGIFEK